MVWRDEDGGEGERLGPPSSAVRAQLAAPHRAPPPAARTRAHKPTSPPRPTLKSPQDAPPPCEPDFALLNARVPQHPALDAPVVRAAYAAAWRAHAGQVRKSGEPVISHCLETAVILAELGLPEETIAAGLLHDVLCDTRTTACQLEEYVPRSCVELVGA